MSGLRWGREVVDVCRVPGRPEDDPVYRVTAVTDAGTETHLARHLVVGVGTRPWSPVETRSLDAGACTALHASDYLPRRDELLARDAVTVVGSGQSAAEVYHDLLSRSGAVGPRIDWVTRSPRFFPMEYTKITLEMTSPEYIDHFHALPGGARDRLLREQRSLYKGIDSDLVNAIHELLYRREVHGLSNGLLVAATELEEAHRVSDGVRLHLRCGDTGRRWTHRTEGLVMATGYAPTPPSFLAGVADELDTEDAPSPPGTSTRYRVARDHSIDRAHSRIWVQNAEEHTHGLTAPDLGMGAMRNSIILRGVTGREVYPVEERIAFQRFGAPVPATAATEVAPPQEVL